MARSTPPDSPRGHDEIVAAAVTAAERLFADGSPDRVSLRAVAEEAGITYSLLNRHIGSKRSLVDAMLARSQQRWKQSTEGAGLDDVLHGLLSDTAETGHYIRLLMWSLLDSDDLSSARRHSSMHELVPLAEAAVDDSHDPTAVTAAALAFIFGWRAFNPYIVAALDADPAGADRLHAAMHTLLDDAIAQLRA